MHFGYLSIGSATPAALVAAATNPESVDALVGRGGRLDHAWGALRNVSAPVLIAVGEHDTGQRAALEVAFPMIGSAEKELLVIPRAGQVLREPTTLEQFAEHAANWFARYLGSPVALDAEIC